MEKLIYIYTFSLTVCFLSDKFVLLYQLELILLCSADRYLSVVRRVFVIYDWKIRFISNVSCVSNSFSYAD